MMTSSRQRLSIIYDGDDAARLSSGPSPPPFSPQSHRWTTLLTASCSATPPPPRAPPCTHTLPTARRAEAASGQSLAEMQEVWQGELERVMKTHGQEVCAASYEGFLRSGRGAVMLNFNIDSGASAASDKTAASAGLLNGVAGDMPWIFLPLSAISATQQRLVAQKARRALASSSLLLSSLFSLRASLSALSSLCALRFRFSSLFSLSSLLAPTLIIRSATESVNNNVPLANAGAPAVARPNDAPLRRGSHVHAPMTCPSRSAD